jgi:hypothetical protein
MSVLKGNYKLDKEVEAGDAATASGPSLKEEFRKKAIANVGGSMVFVERERLLWRGEGEEQK